MKEINKPLKEIQNINNKTDEDLKIKIEVEKKNSTKRILELENLGK